MTVYNNNAQYLDRNCYLNNDQEKLNKCATLLFQILSNQHFIGSISNTLKFARQYYNDRKDFCRAFNIDLQYQQECHQKNSVKHVTLNTYLEGQDRSCVQTKKNSVPLMYIIPQQGLKNVSTLPPQWAPPRGIAWTQVKSPRYIPYVYPVSSQNPFDPPGDKLNNTIKGNSLIIYYYLKHVQFFTSILSFLKQSVIDYNNFKFYCKKIVFPEDIYCGSLKERTFYVSGEFLKQVYDLFLRGTNNNLLLPVPKKSI